MSRMCQTCSLKQDQLRLKKYKNPQLNVTNFNIMIGERVLSNLPFLQLLSRTRNAKKRSQLLSDLTTEQIIALVEICHNIVKNNFKLKPKQLQHLKPHKDFLRKLARKRSIKSAKTVVQNGYGFPYSKLLAPLISASNEKILLNPGKNV